jgi:hypothetical protein
VTCQYIRVLNHRRLDAMDRRGCGDARDDLDPEVIARLSIRPEVTSEMRSRLGAYPPTAPDFNIEVTGPLPPRDRRKPP